MPIGTKKRQIFEREQGLLDFWSSYLSEGFPNPEHKGCPLDETLRALAYEPRHSNQTITDHLTCCSPCFKAYTDHLARARSEAVQSRTIRRATWIRRSLVTAGVAVVLVIAVYVFFARWHRDTIVAPRRPAPTDNPGTPAEPPTAAMYVPVLVDLSNASPARGSAGSQSNSVPQVIPASALIDFTVQLPIGSEARSYSVVLRSGRRSIWAGSAKAHLENGQVLLHMRADFSHVPVGRYDFAAVSNSFRITVPVVVKTTSSEGFKNK